MFKSDNLFRLTLVTLVIGIAALLTNWLGADYVHVAAAAIAVPATLILGLVLLGRLDPDSPAARILLALFLLLLGYGLGVLNNISILLGTVTGFALAGVILTEYELFLRNHPRIRAPFLTLSNILHGWWRHVLGTWALKHGKDKLAQRCAAVVAYKVHRQLYRFEERGKGDGICNMAKRTMRNMRRQYPDDRAFHTLVEERLNVLLGEDCDCREKVESKIQPCG